METSKQTVIDRLVEYVQENCKPVDLEARYDDMLDECFSFESVGGIFAHMQPSMVLKEMDPIAYRCGMNDWTSGEGYFEIGSESYETDDVEKARDAFLDELDSEISDLTTEIEETESDEDADKQELAALQRKIQELEADKETAKGHVF